MMNYPPRATTFNGNGLNRGGASRPFHAEIDETEIF